MPKYRKKPVVIEAFEFRGGMAPEDTPPWFREALRSDVVSLIEGDWCVTTLESGKLAPEHLIQEGDIVIQGVKGELYPCKPDIFAQTYELVAE